MHYRYTIGGTESCKRGNLSLIFHFKGFNFEFQELYSQWQESKDSNNKLVTVKEV